MRILNTLFIIKIMVNSEIITRKSEYRYFQQDEIRKGNLSGEETKLYQ